MEHHGEIPKENVVAIIPARYASTRLPGKLLLDVAGEPLIIHTIRRAAAAGSVSRVLVATDDERIYSCVAERGFEAVMTSPVHASGSDRVAEVAVGLAEGTVIVNVQGDEPTIAPETINLAVEALIKDKEVDIATTCEPITDLHGELLNGNVVKVVIGETGNAIHFSRSPVPYPRDAALRHGGDLNSALKAEPGLLAMYRKHTGLYVYRREYILKFTHLPPTALEKIESLEQLRALENGARIRVVDAFSTSIGVDTADDLERVRIILGH